MHNNLEDFTREDFMAFFRDNEKIDLLTADDRVEIFSYILLGKSDLSKNLLDSILLDYGASGLKINEINGY